MNPMVQTDSYKLSHKGFMNEGTEVIYSNLTARSTKHFPVPEEVHGDKVVVFGLQHTIIEFLINDFYNNFFSLPEVSAVDYLGTLFDAYLGEGSVSTEHFRELHQLGYLPIEIKALPEGTLAPVKVPMYTIKNTDERFAWLTNYLETVMSCETWKASTTATLIYNYRKLVNQWAIKTTGSNAGTEFQLHDFSFRGMANRQDAAKCGASFLLSSNGTDNIPAIPFISKYYDTHWATDFIATSVPASEHSLASTGTAVEGELSTIKRWITESYPSGIVSVISDTFDFWKVITEYAQELKQDILNRIPNELGLAKVVFRPDSGDPVKIITGYKVKEVWENESLLEAKLSGYEAIKYKGKYYELVVGGGQFGSEVIMGKELRECEVKGAVECLWEIFGGTHTDLGYKVLHERVGLIYGDSMTYPIIEQLCKRLADKGFASTNCVFGVGSYTMQYLTRDSLGMAVKATAAKVNGEWYELFKDPITDDGVKKSAKGLLRVDYGSDGNITLYDQQTLEQESQGLLETVFKNGVLTKKYTFNDIKQRLWGEEE